MNTNTMELNMNEMEQVNGGWSIKGFFIGGAIGFVTGGAMGAMAGGLPGAIGGAVVGSVAGATIGANYEEVRNALHI